MDWQNFSLLSLFCLLVFLSAAALLCSLRVYLARMPLVAAASVSYGLVLTLVVVYSLVAQWLLASTTPVRSALDLEQLLLNAFIGAVVAGVGMRYLYVSWQLRMREQSELNARIQALQSRIKPHFLFNSLNTIASLIDEDRTAAERAVEDLSALFRANLQDSRVLSDWASERDLCERYLRIEQARLGKRLRVEWKVDDIPEPLPMLSLSLQPLLENAIIHGIQHLPEGGTIEVLARSDGANCIVAVENPLPATLHDSPGNRLACENLRHRLQSVYGDRGQLTLLTTDGVFRVEMRFPRTVGF